MNSNLGSQDDAKKPVGQRIFHCLYCGHSINLPSMQPNKQTNRLVTSGIQTYLHFARWKANTHCNNGGIRKVKQVISLQNVTIDMEKYSFC